MIVLGKLFALLLKGNPMGDLIFASQTKHPASRSSAEAGFVPFDPAAFAALCWAMKASADQLSETAMKAAVNGGVARGQAQQETYLTMMLGPLVAIDNLRQRLARA